MSTNQMPLFDDDAAVERPQRTDEDYIRQYRAMMAFMPERDIMRGDRVLHRDDPTCGIGLVMLGNSRRSPELHVVWPNPYNQGKFVQKYHVRDLYRFAASTVWTPGTPERRGKIPTDWSETT